MKVIKSNIVEDCLDGVMKKEFLFERPISEQTIRALAGLGDLEFYSDFPRPFYKVTNKGRYVVKGVLGGDTCQVLFINYSNSLEDFLISGLDSLDDGGEIDRRNES